MLGVLGAGKFIRQVPLSVMLGFVNGLAVVMTRAQLRHPGAARQGLASPEALAMVGLTSLTMGLQRLVPRRRWPCRRRLPHLSGVCSVVGAEAARDHVTTSRARGPPRIESPAFAQSAGGLLGFEDRPGRVPQGGPALRGDDGVRRFVESLLRCTVDGIADDGNRGSTRQVLNSLGNLASGLTGARRLQIGQSLINVEAEARRLSGMVMAGDWPQVVSAAPSRQDPIAALVGVMLLVCKQTFSWSPSAS